MKKIHFKNFASKVSKANIDPFDIEAILYFIRENIRKDSFVDFGLILVSAPDETTFGNIITKFAQGYLPELPKNKVGEILFRIFGELDDDCA